MTIREIFEKVNLVTPIEQRRFFNFFADSVDELQAQYPKFVIEYDATYTPPTALTDKNVVRPLYHNAIVDNILFLAGQGETYKSEFLRKSNAAYLKYWNDYEVSVLKIFEKVNLVTPIEQRRFFNYFYNTVTELQSMYRGFVFEKDTEYQPTEDLSDKNVVRPLYHNAIVDNIIFLAGGEETHKTEFIRKSRDAYLKYWNDDAKGRRIKRMRW